MRVATGKTRLILLTLAAVLFGGLAIGLVRDQSATLELTGPTMGTSYSVKVAQLPKGLDAPVLQAAIDGELARINDLMSTYQDDSELSRFNQSRQTDWFDVSPDTLAVVRESVQVSELTQGALDVTVGPLVNLWGFGPEGLTDQVPEIDALEHALARSGLGKLSLQDQPPALRKSHADLYLDLSAVAKGYAVDRIASLLKQQGINDFLIEVGGEIGAGGHRSTGSPWRVAVERPVEGGRAVQQIIEISDRGLATSGDYRNYFLYQGVRYSHVIDPRSGWPVPQTVASVSVVAETAMRADALATGMMVMGADSALDFANQHGIAALIIERTESGFEEHASQAFGAYQTTVEDSP